MGSARMKNTHTWVFGYARCRPALPIYGYFLHARYPYMGIFTRVLPKYGYCHARATHIWVFSYARAVVS